MKRYRTKEEIRMTVTFFKMSHDIIIPKHTRCALITEGTTAGRFWVDDLSWINRKEEPFLHHDATHRGIDLDPSQVEEVT